MKILSILVTPLLLLSFSVVANVKCSDVKYGNDNYHEKMEELAKLAKLPDDYYSRYHESVVNGLCDGESENVDSSIDNGYVDAKEVAAISSVLGINYQGKERSEEGKSYGYSKENFLEMGLCNACADNIAQYYTQKPESSCGKLAKKALEGNPEAIATLKEFPEYCAWEAISETSSGKSITDENWANHPEIKNIRTLYNEINSSQKSKKLTKETKKCTLNDGDIEINSELYKDEKSVVRKYVVNGGTGDSAARAEYYYNEDGIARFTYRFRGAYNGTKIEDRIYFDKNGQHLYKNNKSEGAGYPESELKDSVADPSMDYANLCN